MKALNPRHLLIALSMLVAAGLTLALTPRQRVADLGPEISLEAMIPLQFGEWKLEETIAPILFDPDGQTTNDKIYNQTLNRNYINRRGDQIMLVVAFGGEQAGTVQVHRPEMCYPMLGFQIGEMSKDFIDASGTKLPVMKLVATKGPRVEPIIYWVMMGDTAVRGHWEQFFAKLKYGLTGKIPYGILIRVSTISANESQSYRTEERFVRDMLGAMPVQYRKILTGPDS